MQTVVMKPRYIPFPWRPSRMLDINNNTLARRIDSWPCVHVQYGYEFAIMRWRREFLTILNFMYT